MNTLPVDLRERFQRFRDKDENIYHLLVNRPPRTGGRWGVDNFQFLQELFDSLTAGKEPGNELNRARKKVYDMIKYSFFNYVEDKYMINENGNVVDRVGSVIHPPNDGQQQPPTVGQQQQKNEENAAQNDDTDNFFYHFKEEIELEDLKEQDKDIENCLAAIQAAKADLKEQNKNIEKQKKNNENRLAAIQAEKADLKEQNKNIENRLAAIQAAEADLKEQNKNIEKKKKNNENRLAAIQAAKADLKEQKKNIENRLAAKADLKEQENRLAAIQAAK